MYHHPWPWFEVLVGLYLYTFRIVSGSFHQAKAVPKSTPSTSIAGRRVRLGEGHLRTPIFWKSYYFKQNTWHIIIVIGISSYNIRTFDKSYSDITKRSYNVIKYSYHVYRTSWFCTLPKHAKLQAQGARNVAWPSIVAVKWLRSHKGPGLVTLKGEHKAKTAVTFSVSKL